jgi:Lon protease-like protein
MEVRVTEEAPLFPLNTVLFPGMPLPLHIFEPRYREMIGTCSDEDRPFGVVLIRDGLEVGAPATPFEVGTMAKIVGVDRMPDGRMNIVTVGTKRFRIHSFDASKRSYMVGDVEVLPDEPGGRPPSTELVTDVGALVQRYWAMIQAASEQEITPLQLPTTSDQLSYLVGAVLRVPNEERQRLLEMDTTAARLELERDLLRNASRTLEEYLQRRGGALGPFSRN